MAQIRKRHSAKFKAKVAMEAIKARLTGAQIATKFGVHTGQISQWKKEALEHLPDIFSAARKKQEKAEEELVSRLYEQIGKLQVELDWLKKKSEDVR